MVATVAELDSIELESDEMETVVRADAEDHTSPLQCTTGYSSYCSAFERQDEDGGTTSE